MSQQIIIQDARDPLGLDRRDPAADLALDALTVAGLVVAAVVYLLPAIVAHKRRHPQQLAITVLTVLLGWSVLGWIIAMVWACTATPRVAAP
jgi:hypothetical protein